MENFYAQLDKVCKEHGTTIYAVEKATNSSKGSFIKWRKSSPSTDTLIDIADLLGISMDELVGRKVPAKGKAVPAERPKNETQSLSFEELNEILANRDGLDFVEKVYAQLELKQKIFVLAWLIEYAKTVNIPLTIK